MGFCLSIQGQKLTTTFKKSHNHEKKPYDVATLLAARLWLQQGENFQVIVSVAHTNETRAKALRIKGLLEDMGATPWLLDTSLYNRENQDVACVRMAQLSRAFVHESGLVESDEDTIITSDADAFPVNATFLLEPLQRTNRIGEPYKVYVSTYYMKTRQNMPSFAMCFIAMKTGEWKRAWEATRNMTLQDALQESLSFGHHRFGWNTDQALVSAAIFNAGYCALPPPKSRLYWRTRTYHSNRTALEWNATRNDTMTCNKGTARTRGDPRTKCEPQFLSDKQKCQAWTHFSTDATLADLVWSYESIARRYPGYVNASSLLGWLPPTASQNASSRK